ncbi:trypsin delta-like [Neodiprion virginianus]|uniref:Trypsin delta-like n=1 Tax=Neodiprion lecontei TaxID=441921 RepID=A0A6J0C0E3_NEOLC|nr:trypsin delta-like [Neodiprion lecontei]XP_046613073.1 trypsin delta-like [Neodiprion virginianus]
MMKIAILFALVAAAVAEPTSLLNSLSPTGRIVGGVATSIDEVPYQVSLQVFGSHICGGALISDTWVLTAAHCMVYPTAWFTIRSGSTLSNSGGSTTSFASVINHASYGSNRWGIPINDIALIRLSSAVSLGSTRAAISLYSANEEAVVGSAAVITGWGALTEGGSSPVVLQTVTVPIVSKSDCNTAYRIWGGLPDGQICAAVPEGGKDACQGDSGGPLAISGRLAGVVSWGNGCARAGWPGVYTEVASYRSWISTNSGI